MTQASVMDPLERQVAEACDSLWAALVDPREAYLDDDGAWWSGVGVGGGGGGCGAHPCPTELQLAEARLQCRRLAATNEFAINGLENRISYLVGAGHSYRAVSRKNAPAAAAVVAETQLVLDEFLYVNRWHARQQETVRRMDRDGEAFLRFFVDAAGMTRVRFIEPEQVYAPPEQAAATFGVLTDPGDVETPVAYFVDGERVAASEVQHRKANVDANVKRGLPLYYPVRKNLRRVEKLLRNMSALAEVQSAIALIRKHRAAVRNGVEAFAAEGVADPGRGFRTLTQFAPGTILDAPLGLEYQFPAASVNASHFVAVLQAELRAIAARLVMPEFMFTSDASNANYSSTLVAEGPAVKMFERLQAGLKCDDYEVLWRVIENAASSGRLPGDVRRLVDLQVTLPSLHVRDQLRECQIERIAFEKGILSAQTWSQRMGLDFDHEQKNRASHDARPAESRPVARRDAAAPAMSESREVVDENGRASR